MPEKEECVSVYFATIECALAEECFVPGDLAGTFAQLERRIRTTEGAQVKSRPESSSHSRSKSGRVSIDFSGLSELSGWPEDTENKQ